MEMIIRPREARGPGQQALEVVERKGIGHPDTICDAIAEHVSQRLCRYYLERFGAIQHHNVDKVLLCGGTARASFGGGEVFSPIEIYLAGRATDEVGERVPTAEIAIDACQSWLARHLPELDLARQVRIIPRLHPGAASLTALFARGSGSPLANDTSCAVGFAPLTELERVVLEVERCLNAEDTKREHPAIGWDVKLMGVRRHSRVDLTIACALVARHIPDAGTYLHVKETVRALAVAAAERVTGRLEINAVVNAADDVERGEMYLTVTGTSAESGDDGEVGRGNRCNGLITPYRPMTMEATAGKNPVSHVGKLYNLAAQRMSESLLDLPDVSDATCRLVSRIGKPVDQPSIVDIELDVPVERLGALMGPAAQLARAVLGDLGGLRRALLDGHLRVY